jgi:coenzyme F420-reducing hydrogenase alpha subunit
MAGHVELSANAHGWRFADRRPQGLPRLLTGRSPDEATRLAALIFPYCAMSHVVALKRAFADAGKTELPKRVQTALRWLELADSAAAHVWRASINWAGLLGEPPAVASLSAARAAAKRIAHRVLAKEDASRLFGRAPDDASSLDADFLTLMKLVRATGATAEMMEQQAAGLFPAGQMPFAAQALDAARHVAEMQTLAPVAHVKLPLPQADGAGEGSALTSRGDLLYRVELREGTVASCTAVTPTDIAFAEDGPAASALAGAKDERAALLIAAAHDPCVPVVVAGPQGHA